MLGFQSGPTITNNAIYQYDTTNGYGSTDTRIRRFTNNTVSSDTSALLTVANTAGNGMTITVNRRARVHISYSEVASAATHFGLTKNSVQLTTDFTSTTVSTRLAIGVTPAA